MFRPGVANRYTALMYILLSTTFLAIIFIVAYQPNYAILDTAYRSIDRNESGYFVGTTLPRPRPYWCASCHCIGRQEDPTEYDVEVDIEKAIPPLDELYRRLAIVTAISTNHYQEALPWIASIQTHMPDKKITVYDIGLNNESLAKVKLLCNVEVRPFPFSSYPNHVKNLHTYAWKPVIIDMTVKEFGVIFWGDSSIRLKASLKNLLPIALKHHGYMTHFHAFDPKKKEEIKHQYFFTHPQLYANLGVNRRTYYMSKDMAPHAAANRQLYINGSVIQEKIVQPMLKCALEYRCIAPEGAHLGSHRFDASILAILIYKNLRGEWTRAGNDNRAFDEVVYLEKKTLGREKVKSCPEAQGPKHFLSNLSQYEPN